MSEVDPNLIKPLRISGGDIGCLLIHGFTSCPLDIRPLTQHLAREGFTVHETILPGHGTSPQGMITYSWRDWIRAVENELDLLEQKCSRVWLVGFSMGGMLASILASRRNAEGLVSIAAPVWPRAKSTRFAFIMKYFMKFAPLGKRPEFDVPSWRYQEVPVKNIADLMKIITLGKKALPKVKIPTLVVQGEEDRTIEPRSADYIFRHLGSRDKEIIWTKGGHMLLLEPRRNHLSERIAQFIKNRTGGNENGCNQAGQ